MCIMARQVVLGGVPVGGCRGRGAFGRGRWVGAGLAGWASVLGLALSLVGSTLAETVIPFGSGWSYHVGTEAPAGVPEAWRRAEYDETGWRSGLAPIGYGEPDIITSLPSSAGGNYLTVYFRRRFQVDQPGKVTALVLTTRVDDGYVAWINGVEVGRANVPEGELEFNRTALTAGEPFLETITLSENLDQLLVAGANVLAIHALNANSTSSDLLLDASLEAVVDGEPPEAIDTVPAPGSVVPELTQIEVTFSESVTGVEAADLLVNGQPAAAVSEISPRQYSFQFAAPPVGLVQVTWAQSHGIRDLAPEPNPFAGGSWTYTVQPAAASAAVAISEFMADNDNGIRDEDGNRSDWIELQNRGGVGVDLEGWFLTDTSGNLTKWRFPASILPANQYLVVWASEKHRTNPAAPLHTNFKLDNAGEYLALVDAQTNIVSAFAPAYPAQRPDISYGRDRADPALVGYFITATPGAPNATSGPGFAPDPVFSLPGGVYTNLSLSIALSSAGGTIHYTTDGSVPTENSARYGQPLATASSLRVKARVFVPGLWPSRVVAESYQLLDANLREFSSNLPLLIVNTHGRWIAENVPPGVERTRASVVAIEPRRGRSALRGPAEFVGLGQVEIRGQSSTGFPKKAYNLELNDEWGQDREVSLLGLPAESDWVLYNPYSDKPFIQNFLAYELHEQMGHYAVRRRFVEVFVDTNGGRVTYPTDYAGIYILLEKIKVDRNRVAIASLAPTHSAEPEISGGYIVKKDKSSAGDRTFTTSGGAGFSGQELRFHEPKPREITVAQQQWIRNYFNAFERALYASNWLTATGTNHYSHYMDADSFVDNHWIVEFAKQIDGYRLSNYLHKDRGGKLKMDPIWDWNLSFGNADYLDGANPSGWYYVLIDATAHPWLRRLITGSASATTRNGDPDFNQRIIDRWSVLRTNVMSAARVLARVDELAALLDEAQVRDFQRWPRLGTRIWPNPPMYSQPRTYAEIVANMKQWIADRCAWIDRQFVLAPALSHGGGSVPPGLLLTLSAPAGSLYYTLDGSDPRWPGGGLSSAARLYSGPLTVVTNARVVARARLGANWSGPTARTFATCTPPLRLVEIMYHPAEPEPGSPHSGAAFEYLEFLNVGAEPLAVEGYRVSGTVDFTFPKLTLNPGQRTVVASSRAAFAARYSSAAVVAGEFTGKLGNDGGRLILEGRLGEPLLDFRYEDYWHRLTDGFGFALAIRDELAEPGTWSAASSWRAGTVLGGTPGLPEPPLPLFPPVVVNEVLTHADLPQVDAIELHNLSYSPADVSGWYLTDDVRRPNKFRLPEGTRIPPRGYLVLSEADFNNAARARSPFTLSSLGEEAYLFSADPAGDLTGYVHGFDFGAAKNGVTFGRYLSSSGEERFVAQWQPTLGAANSGPRVGPVAITEVMYRPPEVFANGAYWNNDEDEFIELHNPGSTVVSLFDGARPTNTWKLGQAVEFSFPPGTSLPAGGFLLVVSFDPVADSAQLAGFRSRYGLGASTPIFGPYRGQLSNRDEKVTLYEPDAPQALGPDAGMVPYVVVDRVHYADRAPWPVAADGAGHSIQRLDPLAFGNDWANWFAAMPTPGRSGAPGVPPVLTSEPLDRVVPLGGRLELSAMATAAGGGSVSYQWRFNRAVLAGATNRTLVIAAVQSAHAGSYQVLAFNAAGAVTSREATVRLDLPITITQQPATQRVLSGASALLTVVATSGNPPLSYQWYRNGRRLPSATEAFLAFSRVQEADQGIYVVRLADAVRTLDSAPAEVRLLAAPEMSAPVPPLELTAVAGEPVTLSARTRGTTPMRYRWSRTAPGGGSTVVAEQVLDANVVFLRLGAVTAADAGTYTLTLTNEFYPALDRTFTNARLTILADADGDFMPDVWEEAHGLDPADAGDAAVDSDGDGLPNLAEYRAGTDPKDASSCLRFETISVRPGATLEFLARPNRTYTLEATDRLEPSVWTPLADEVAAGTTRRVTVLDPDWTASRYYRLVTPRRL